MPLIVVKVVHPLGKRDACLHFLGCFPYDSGHIEDCIISISVDEGYLQLLDVIHDEVHPAIIARGQVLSKLARFKSGKNCMAIFD